MATAPTGREESCPHAAAGLLPRTAISDEFRLLLHTAGGPDRDAYIDALLQRPLDWAALLSMAEHERATAPLARRLGHRMPADVAAHWRRLAMIGEFEQAQLERRLRALLQALGPAASDVVLLKGAALGCTVYPAFRDRPMRDLDLLVPRSLLGTVREAALAHGWRRGANEHSVAYELHQHAAPMADAEGTGVQLELHTELLADGHPFRLSGAEVLARSVPVTIDGVACRVPAAADMLLHLVLHFGWVHGLSDCAWRTFRDARHVIAAGGFDWDEYAERTRAASADQVSFWTLGFGAAYSGLAVPPALLKTQARGVPRLGRRLLARHLAPSMGDARHQSPSVRLSRWMWTRALALPRHVAPWQREALFPAREPPTGDRRKAVGRRLVTRTRLLLAYARDLLR